MTDAPASDRVLRAFAPAKINRELRVGGLRPDGFHEILSRFSSIDLSDEIEVEIELKWSTGSAAGRAEPAPEESGVEGKNAAARSNGKRNRRT